MQLHIVENLILWSLSAFHLARLIVFGHLVCGFVERGAV